MNIVEAMGQLKARAMELLAASADLSADELAAFGYDAKDVNQIERLAAVYFGPTTSTRKQREAVDAATAGGHTMNTLELIETYVRRLDDDSLAWTLRRDLCREKPDYYALQATGRERVAKLNGPKKPEPARTAVTMSNPSDRLDRTLYLTGPEHRVANLMDRARDHAKKTGVELAEAVFEVFEQGSGGAPAYTPKVVIRLEDYLKVLGGETGDDIIVGATNGARMTGAQFMQSVLTEHFECVLVDPVKGPISLGRARRRATAKQRGLVECQLMCSEPGCGIPVDRSEINHDRAWKDGGGTDIENLSVLCRYHNGKGGRYETAGGVTVRIYPGGRRETNNHPTALLGAGRIV